MTISIVLPSFNHKVFLSERLASIFNQIHPWDELIIVDDCSTDGSAEFFERYLSDPRVRLLTNKVNSGSPSQQWLRGLNESKGDVIWIAESDDSSDLCFLEKMVEVLEKTGATFCYCDSYLIDSDSRIIGIAEEDLLGCPQEGRVEALNMLLYSGEEFSKYNLVKRNSIPNVSACLFNRVPLLRHCEKVAGFRYIGDWHLYLRLLTRGTVAKVPEKLNFFRQHPNTTRTRHRGLTEWGRILTEYGANGLLLQRRGLISEDEYATLQGDLARTVSLNFLLQHSLSSERFLSSLFPSNAERLLIVGFGEIGQKVYTALLGFGVEPQKLVAFDRVVRGSCVMGHAVICHSLDSLSVNASDGDHLLIASISYADELESHISSLGILVPRVSISNLVWDLI